MEKAKSVLEMIKDLKNEVKSESAGTGSFSNELYYSKKDNETEKKLRFITEINDAHPIKYHIKKKKEYIKGQPFNEYAHPCLTQYGKECPTCEIDAKPKTFFCLTVYDYTNEFEPKRFIAEPFANCKMIKDLDKVHTMKKTITDCDYMVRVMKAGTTEKSYEFEPVEDSENFEKEVVPYTKEEILEELKKGNFSFSLPEGVLFSELPDLSEEPF